MPIRPGLNAASAAYFTHHNEPKRLWPESSPEPIVAFRRLLREPQLSPPLVLLRLPRPSVRSPVFKNEKRVLWNEARNYDLTGRVQQYESPRLILISPGCFITEIAPRPPSAGSRSQEAGDWRAATLPDKVRAASPLIGGSARRQVALLDGECAR